MPAFDESYPITYTLSRLLKLKIQRLKLSGQSLRAWSGSATGKPNRE
jgi:hypothetical protein